MLKSFLKLEIPLFKFISSVALVFFIAVLLFPASFVGDESFSKLKDASYLNHNDQGLKIIYCRTGLVCNIHFLKLGSAYAHFLITNQIVVDTRRLVDGVVYKPKYGKQRTLKSLLEHEIEHSRQLHQLGYVRYLLSNKWIGEGLAEMRSSDHSITNISKSDICKPESDKKTGAEKYFIYRKLVSFFLDGGKTEAMLFKENISYTNALRQYCAGRLDFPKE
jgi:hypothetical protein